MTVLILCRNQIHGSSLVSPSLMAMALSTRFAQCGMGHVFCSQVVAQSAHAHK